MTRHARVAAILGMAVAMACAACEPGDRAPARSPKPRPCPPPPEPAYLAAVVGTIGKMHMVESRYPLSKLGDVLSTFKPDLVLVAVRVEAFREAQLEDASFEMTYVSHLAKQHGINVEPIDWFREQDLVASVAAAEPWDVSEIVKKEAEVLGQPPLYTFEQANGAELEQRVMLANGAQARHRAGNPLTARRQAWIQHLVANAVSRHGRPRRVLAYVDVLDRPAVDLVLHGVGYTMREPVDLVSKSKDEMIAGIPVDVTNDWRAQLDRTRSKLEAAKAEPEKAFWAGRQRSLAVVVDKRGACCVTQSALTNSPER